MQLLDFTAEIIYIIIDCLPTQRDVSAFTRTSRSLYDGFHETLYTSTKDKQELLQWTCENGNANLAKKMLQLGAKAKLDLHSHPPSSSSEKTKEYEGPVSLALRECQYEVAHAIMDFDPSSINYIDPQRNESPIGTAINSRNSAAVKEILSRPELDPRKEESKPSRTIIKTALFGFPWTNEYQEKIIKRLIKDSRFKVDRYTILAAIPSHLPISFMGRILIRGKQYLKSAGEEILIEAASALRADLVKYILTVSDKLDPSIFTGPAETTTLLSACRDSEADVIDVLLSRNNINLEYQNERGQTPLTIATERSHLKILKLLIEKGKANPNAQDSEGQTALIIASRNRTPTIVEYLLSIPGINLNITDLSNKTALSHAAHSGANKVVHQLLATDLVNPNHRDNTGTTPLIQAIRGEAFAWRWKGTSFDNNSESHKEGIITRKTVHKVLHGEISHEEALNSGYQARRMPHICHKCRARKERQASRRKTEEKQFCDALDVVNQLVKRDDVQVDSADEQGRTPLFWAVGWNQVDAVVSLIESGKVDIHYKSFDGMTPDGLSLGGSSSN